MESEIERSMAELYAPPVRTPRGGPWSHVGCGWCCAVCGGYVRVPGVRGAYVGWADVMADVRAPYSERHPGRV